MGFAYLGHSALSNHTLKVTLALPVKWKDSKTEGPVDMVERTDWGHLKV